MRSWDYFDTLHGRSCGEPWRIFDLVGGEEYRKVRQAAEIASDKTWTGIFKSLHEITGWSLDRVDELRHLEERAERDCGFPIVENVRQFRPTDRIITDTYFAADQVQYLAAKIGLPGGLDIAASWDGKWTGRYWRSPSARGITLHVGDNPRSDVSQAKAAGLEARRYTAGAWTKAEADLDKAGLWEIAGAARAARLQNPHEPGSPAAAWWDGAAAANVPFVLAAAALVRQYVEAARPARVAFVSRDSLLLGEAYASLYTDDQTCRFWASRETFRRPSASYLTYVKRIAPGTLFVDLHGTGRTMRQFCRTAGLDLSWVFVCGQRRLQAHAPALVTLTGIGTGTAVEVMNYHDQGRVVDVVDGRPVRADLEYDLAPVAVHRAATLAGVAACCRRPQGVTADHVAQAAEAIRRTVPRELLRQHEVEHGPR